MMPTPDLGPASHSRVPARNTYHVISSLLTKGALLSPHKNPLQGAGLKPQSLRSVSYKWERWVHGKESESSGPGLGSEPETEYVGVGQRPRPFLTGSQERGRRPRPYTFQGPVGVPALLTLKTGNLHDPILWEEQAISRAHAGYWEY